MNTTTPISQLLGIEDHERFDIIMTAGEEYISMQRAWTQRGREKLLQSRTFWSWWWRNWLACDDAMMANPLAKMAVDEYLRHHLQAHAWEMPRVMWTKVTLDSDCRMRTKRKLKPAKVRAAR